ncbi:helix-turn-helix domain-containing protein [Streptomyces sp. NPDC001852]|uniref:helix-turn-helix domain-containing protein n=1 Tax=Streptomyces sp. NPDC001852 TaxID=3364619 RepID=UPI003696FEEE
MVEKIAMSVDETVEVSGLSRSTVYELIRSGDLQSVKEGSRRLVIAASVRAYFQRRLEEQSARAA